MIGMIGLLIDFLLGRLAKHLFPWEKSQGGA